MRLPENKKDRQKVLAMIALGVVAVGYGIWVGVYNPLRRGRDEAAQKIVEYREDMRMAQEHIQRTVKMKRELEETLRNLQERSERDLLHPRLGNYLLQARQTVEGPGLIVGAENIQVVEIGLVEPPKPPKSTNDYVIRAYSARVTAECGFEAFAEWIRLLEEANSLFTFSLIALTENPDNPQKHLLQFEAQWPVWADSSRRDTVNKMAAEILKGEAK